jgi:two-component system LytT family response regulator
LMNCGQRSYPMRQTLSGLAEQLDPGRFMRVHRTAIVNLKQIDALQEQGELQLQLLSGANVPVSKTYLSQLKSALTNGSSARS